MTNRLRIAMLGSRGIPSRSGGVERSVEEISVRLAARGHDVTVYCRRPYVDRAVREWEGVELRFVPTVNTKHLEAISHTACATAHAAAQKFDVIHYHATGPALFAPVARATSSAVVATVQGLDYRRQKWGPLARIALKSGAFASARFPHETIVVSQALRRFYRETFGREAVYIPNGVDVASGGRRSDPPLGLERDGYALFLGRLVPEKAIDHLIRAFREVDHDVDLVIAGESSHTDAYVRHLQDLASGDSRIRFVGGVYDSTKDALLENAALVVQPSLLEGLPIALLEALAKARCVVASDLPEHLEVVGTSGALTFKTGDIEDLRRAIGAALDDADLRARLGGNGCAIVASEYRWDGIVDSIESVYARAVSQRGRRRLS